MYLILWKIQGICDVVNKLKMYEHVAIIYLYISNGYLFVFETCKYCIYIYKYIIYIIIDYNIILIKNLQYFTCAARCAIYYWFYNI